MLLHSPKKKLNADLNLEVDGTAVEQVWVFKYLGVLINDTLTWNNHVDMVSGKVSRSLNLLRRLSWFLPQSLLLLYLKSYILPHFDYCDVVWAGCTQKDSHWLETLLNFGCKIVLCRCRASSSATALRDLGLTTLLEKKTSHGPVHVQVLIFPLSTLSFTAVLFCFLPLHSSILLYLST